MPDPTTYEKIKSLEFSANELKLLTQWPDAVIEDYLNIVRSLLTIAETLDTLVDRKIEEIATDFLNGSIPYVRNGFLIEANSNFIYDHDNMSLSLFSELGKQLRIGYDQLNYSDFTTDEDGYLHLSSSGGPIFFDNYTSNGFVKTSGSNGQISIDTTTYLPLSSYKVDGGTSQGQLLFWDASTGKWTYTETTEMFWDDTNKRIGIGTSSPTKSIDIQANSNTYDGVYAKNSNSGTSAQVQHRMLNNGSGLCLLGITSTGFTAYTIINSGRAYLLSSSVDLVLGTMTAKDIIFCLSGSEVGKIDTNGLTITNKVKGGSGHFGGSSHYSEFEDDGTLKLNGNATVFKDLIADAGRLTRLGSSDPGLVKVTDNGSGSTGLYLPAFIDGSSKELQATFELQHDYREGTDLVIHLHWFPSTTDTGNIDIEYEYVIHKGSTALGTSTKSNLLVAGPGTAKKATRTDLVTVSGSGVKIGDQITVRFSRDARVTNTNDTFIGDVYIQTLGIHYECDTIGSRSITTK